MNYHKIPDELLNEFEETVHKFSLDYTKTVLMTENAFDEEDLEFLHHYTQGVYENIFEGNSAVISQRLNDIKNYSHITTELRESASDLLERYSDITHELQEMELKIVDEKENDKKFSPMEKRIASAEKTATERLNEHESNKSKSLVLEAER